MGERGIIELFHYFIALVLPLKREKDPCEFIALEFEEFGTVTIKLEQLYCQG